MLKIILVGLLSVLVQFGLSQEFTISGKVFNIRNQVPVQDALVEAFRTDRHTFTDSSGCFAFEIPVACPKLIITSKYFEAREVKLKGKYTDRPLKIGLTDSIRRQNLEAPRTEIIMTSESEYRKCIIKRFNKYYVDKDYRVLYVITTAGDTIRFNKRVPGRIHTEAVIGMPQVIINYDVIPDSVVFNKNAKIQAIWKDGARNELIMQDTIGYICHSAENQTYPFSSLIQIKVMHSNFKNPKVGITLAVAIPVTAFGILLYIFGKEYEGISISIK